MAVQAATATDLLLMAPTGPPSGRPALDTPPSRPIVQGSAGCGAGCTLTRRLLALREDPVSAASRWCQGGGGSRCGGGAALCSPKPDLQPMPRPAAQPGAGLVTQPRGMHFLVPAGVCLPVMSTMPPTPAGTDPPGEHHCKLRVAGCSTMPHRAAGCMACACSSSWRATSWPACRAPLVG